MIESYQWEYVDLIDNEKGIFSAKIVQKLTKKCLVIYVGDATNMRLSINYPRVMHACILDKRKEVTKKEASKLTENLQSYAFIT